MILKDDFVRHDAQHRKFQRKEPKRNENIHHYHYGCILCVSWFHVFFSNSFQLSTHKNTKNTPKKKKATDFQIFFIFLGSFHFCFPRENLPRQAAVEQRCLWFNKNTEVWDASKLKYEVIDTKLTGAPLQVVETDKKSIFFGGVE